MNVFLKTSLLLACCAALSTLSVAVAQDAQQEPIRILFIGNSFTHVNSLDKVTSDMLNASGYPTEAKRSAPGGWRLIRHFNGEVPNEKTPKTPDVIRSEKWDYVVLQEYSSGAVDRRAEFLEYGKKLNDFILENDPKTKVLLYQTWERCDGMLEGYGDDDARKAEVLAAWTKRYSEPNDATVEALKDGICGGYDALAREIDATVVPAGRAFLNAGSKLDLFLNEAEQTPYHPNPNGTYLAACCFYKTIVKESPCGMWKKLDDAGMDLDVSEEDAAVLEKIADETTK